MNMNDSDSEKRSRIFEIADKLHIELGKIPTCVEVRDVLGKGSMSDIAPFVKEWRNSKLAPKKSAVAAATIPENVLEIMNKHNLLIWETANQNSLTMISAIKEEYEVKMAGLDEELKMAYEDNDTLVKSRDDLQVKLDDSINKFREKDIELISLTREKELLEKSQIEYVADLKLTRDDYKRERDEISKKYNDLIQNKLNQQ